MSESLALGNSVSFILGGNDFVTVVGSSTVIANGPKASVNATVTGSRKFGPYAGGATVRIVATGSVTYTVARQTVTRASTAIVDFGDSWGALSESASAGYETSFGWLRVLNVLLGKPFRTIIKAGIDGNTTPMMLSRFDADVVNTNAGWVKIPAGTVNDPANGVDYRTAIACVTAMCAKAVDAGFRVILQACPPNGNITNASYPERRRYQSLVNTWARGYAADNGFLFADVEKYNQDPATGNFISGHSFDSTHLSSLGAQRLAKGCQTDFGSQVPVIRPSGNGFLDPYNLLGALGQPVGNNADGTNGFKLETGCTGTGPNGWATRRAPSSADAAVVTSTISRPSDYPSGSAARLVYTAGADEYKGGWWMVGADSLQADHGHWNKVWGASGRAAGATLTWKDKVRPSTPNGFIYVPVAIAGAIGATEPTWPTEEGGFVTDGGVTWMAVRIPVAGEELYAEAEIDVSSLTGNGGVMLTLNYQTAEAGNATTSTFDNFYTGDSTRGQYPDVAMGRIVLRTKAPLIVPDSNPLLIYAVLQATGRASSVVQMDVIRVKVGNASREASLFA